MSWGTSLKAPSQGNDDPCDETKGIIFGGRPRNKIRKPSTRGNKDSGLEQENEELRQENEELQQENQGLQRQLDMKQGEGARIKKAADQMQLHLDNKELFLGTQASDADVIGRFETLFGSIKTWSLEFTIEEPDKHGYVFEGHFKTSMYRNVAFSCRDLASLHELLKDGRKRRLFARGLVAYVICTTVFLTSASNGYDYWLDRATSDSFRSLERQFYMKDISYRELNDWRAFTAELLSKAQRSCSLEGAAVDDLKTSLNTVRNMMQTWIAPERSEAHFDALFDIMRQAVSLSQFFRRQRACWSVRFLRLVPIPNNGDGDAFEPHKYNHIYMKDRRLDDKEDYEPLGNRIVEFVISPVLYKRGSSNGEHFDYESVVRRAEVEVRPEN